VPDLALSIPVPIRQTTFLEQFGSNT